MHTRVKEVSGRVDWSGDLTAERLVAASVSNTGFREALLTTEFVGTSNVDDIGIVQLYVKYLNLALADSKQPFVYLFEKLSTVPIMYFKDRIISLQFDESPFPSCK